MVEITIENDKAIFEVQGWDKLWSLRSRLEVSLLGSGMQFCDSGGSGSVSEKCHGLVPWSL